MKKEFKWLNFTAGLCTGALLLGCWGYIYTQYNSTPPKPPPKPSPIVQPTKDLSKIIQIAQPKIDPSSAKAIAKSVEKYSKEYGFPPELIIAIIQKESSFRPMAISKANCVGLMQIHVKMHKEKLTKLNIKDSQIFYIDKNIQIGCMILKEYYDATGTISGALKKYLGGNNKSYLLTILSSFADLIIKQDINLKK